MRITTPALFLTCLCADLTAIAQAPNDACADAIPISCGITVGGSTSEAMLDPAAGNCGTAVSAAGVWYSIAGTGEVITLSTCPSHTFDTKINVYTGSCGTPSCVTGNDDGGGCGTGSTASFLSEQGTTYLVLIQGYDGQTGDFELSVSCGPVTYDHCQGATPISCNQSLPGSTVEATADAVPFFCVTGIQAPGVWYTFTGISDPILISTCESSDFDTRLNVYSGTCGALACVAGDDDTEGVGLCSTVSLVPDPATTYYILVQGYDGQTGDFLLELACQTCGTPSDVSATASDETAYVFWTSLNPGATYMIEHGPLGFVPGNGVVTTGTVNGNAATAVITGLASGTEYAFYVQEECGPGDLSQRIGPFTFFTLAEEPAVNATCAGALPLACGGSVEGNTSEGFYLPLPECGPAHVTSPGLWYTIMGTGETITVSTCDTADFDTKISVLTGSCDALVCVGGSDDAPGCPQTRSEASFLSEAGTPYFILVHAYQTAVGYFTLTATCTPTCSPIAANDDCTNPEPLLVEDTSGCIPTMGSNACAFASGVPNPPCDPYVPAVDLWYSFNTGEQESVTFFIAAMGAEAMSAALYTNCGTVEYIDCDTDVDGPWTVNDLAPNTELLLRVWNGGGPDAGTFAVCIESDLSTDVQHSASDGTHLWPNPALDHLQVTGIPEGASSLQLVDLQGRVLRHVAVNGQATVGLHLNDLAAGSYLVRTLGPDATILGRVVKQ